MSKKLPVRKNLIFPLIILFLFIIIITILNSSNIKNRLMDSINVKNFEAISSTDRILILAPHPDDETLSSSGIIQKALLAGAKVKVVFLTNGEYNQESYLIYEKKPLILKSQFINLGKIRMIEALEAAAVLGLGKSDLIFLGYPDFGTMDIFSEYWDKNKPYANIIERISNVPYIECKSPDAPYIGQSILGDIEDILKEFKPSKIIVSSPVDTNRDHQALYLFLRVALWDLKQEIGSPQFYTYLVHSKNWPAQKGIYSEGMLDIPKAIQGVGEDWINSYLSAEEIGNKSNAISKYVSQIKYNPSFLPSFVRKNELFSVFKDIEITRTSEFYIDGSNPGKTVSMGANIQAITEGNNLSKVSFKLEGEFLTINLGLKRKIDQAFGISVYLIGYNNKNNFAKMPKIHIELGIKGMSIKDRFKIIDDKNFSYYYQGNDLILKIPLSLIGSPDYILSHIKTHSGDIILDDTAWRVLELKY
jgi:N-acetyl-1-D-myo-inositol-2-amino-2-deoxy-alpha-D-glucopyranoside deacetylase